MKGLAGYLLYRLLAGVFALMPAAVVRRSGRGIGRLLSYPAVDRLALQRRHMRRLLGPDPSEDEITEAGREMFASYGRYWAELFWFRPRRSRWVVDHTDVTGEEAVLAAKAEGRGIIFAVPHLGNWEVAAPLSHSLGLPLTSVAEELPNRRITDWFIKTRAGFGVDILIAGRGSTISSLVRALKAGQVVALVADRDVTGTGVEVEFFGERTTMPSGPAALSELTGAAVFPIGTYFDGGGYRVVAHPELEMPPVEDRSERLRLGTQALATVFEEIILEAPTQWHLFQPNWPSDRQWLEERQ